MPNYRPGVRVVLRLRIDEGADTTQLVEALQRKNAAAAAKGAASSNTAAAGGASVGSAGNPAAQRRAVTAAKLAQSRKRGKVPSTVLDAENAQLEAQRKAIDPGVSGLPQGLTDGVDAARTVTFEVRPLTVSYERGSIADASTCSIRFDHSALPIDPRTIRSCEVRVYLGDVDADLFAAGINDGERLRLGTVNVPEASLPYSSELPVGPSFVRFEGFADSWHIQFSESGNTVEVSARDLSAILRDQRMGREQLDLTVPIVEGVQALIDSYPASKGLPVVFGPASEINDIALAELYAGRGRGAGPIPADSLSPLKARVAKRKRSGGAKSAKKKENQSVWDAIAETCLKLGLQAVMRGRVLFLQSPQAQYSAAEPFVLFYGEQLTELSFDRKLEGVNDDTIQVECPDPIQGRTLWARYPVLRGEPKSGVLGITDPVTSRAQRVTPAGTPEERVLVRQVAGVFDLGVLEAIAKQTFQQIARQTISGSFTTRDLVVRRLSAGLAGVAVKPWEFLRVFPGDAVLVLVAPAVQVAQELQPEVFQVRNSFQDLANAGIAERTERFVQLGLARSTAQKLAAAQENIQNANKFQVHGVKVAFDHENGLEITVDFQNFITVRDEEARSTIDRAQQQTLRASLAEEQREARAAALTGVL